MKPHASVAEHRVKGELERDSALQRRWRALDYFATPPWACRAGAELVKDIDPDARSVWEPACGDGIMARCVVPYFDEMWATDIAPQGYGEAVDFFDVGTTRFDWIITNPPFMHAARFIEEGLKKVSRGVAILARVAFIEAETRYQLQSNYLTHMCPFTERVGIQLGPWRPTNKSATAYAWFIYSKDTRINGLFYSNGTVLRLIPPGTRQRLWLKDDAAKFGGGVYMPLLDGRA